MTRNEKISISIQSLFNFADIMYRLFVSIYIYIYTNSLVTTTVYTLIRMIAIPILIYVSGLLKEKHSLTFIYVLGFVFQTLSLVWALYATPLFEINIAYVYVSAIFMGTGEGLYYFSTNTSMQLVTNSESRPKFYSHLGILKTVAAFIAPLVANRLIAHSSSDLMAYRKVLVLLIFLYITISIISLKLRVDAKVNKVNIKNNIDWQDKKWRDVLIATFFSTIREALNWSLLAILVSNASGSGKTYSTFQTIFQLSNFILYFFVTKALCKKYFKYSFFIGTVAYSLCAVILVLKEDLLGAIIYGFMNVFNEVFFNTAYNLVVSKILDEHKEEINSRIIVREFAYIIGRIPAMLFIVLCYYLFPSDVYYKVPVILYAICPFITYKLMVKYY